MVQFCVSQYSVHNNKYIDHVIFKQNWLCWNVIKRVSEMNLCQIPTNKLTTCIEMLKGEKALSQEKTSTLELIAKDRQSMHLLPVPNN